MQRFEEPQFGHPCSTASQERIISLVNHVKTVLLNLFRFRSPPAVDCCIPIHPVVVNAWVDVTIIIVLCIDCSLLDHGICSTLSTACFPPCSKLAIPSSNWFYFVKCFFRFTSTSDIWKEERTGFLLEESFTTDNWGNFTVFANIRAAAWKIVRDCFDECRVCFVNDSAVLNEPKTTCYV